MRHTLRILCLFILLLAKASVWVDDLDVELLGALDDGAALDNAHVVSNDSRELLVVHEQDVQVSWVEDAEAAETVLLHMAGLLVRAVTTSRHQWVALVLTANAVVDTAWSAPCGLCIAS